MSKWTKGQRNKEGLTYEQNAAMWKFVNAIIRADLIKELEDDFCYGTPRLLR